MPKALMKKPQKNRIENALIVLFNSVCNTLVNLYGFNGFSKIVRNFIESYNSKIFSNES